MSDMLIKKRLRQAEDRTEVPVLNFNSTDPLPESVNESIPQLGLAENAAGMSMEVGAIEDDQGTHFDTICLETQDGNVWIQGDSVLFPCPDCHAPLSIRLWLMVADCWQCGTAVELSEEQRRAVEEWMQRNQSQNRETRRRPAPLRLNRQPPRLQHLRRVSHHSRASLEHP